jgi:hypothetical protein
MNYGIGDLITWESHSGGTVKMKTGTIVGLCPAWETPIVFHEDTLLTLNSSRWKSRPAASKNDRYIVKVDRGGKSVLCDYFTPSVATVDGVRKSSK